ncbi:MAG: hypothetical protein HUU56_01875 [Bdellovibrionaceae bacterium]|nr:hypothetical protein [Pseudobdellovibrionaceae bacterium]
MKNSPFLGNSSWLFVANSFSITESLAQLRTPQSQFYQLQDMSPLNDRLYFKRLLKKYSSASDSESKLKKIKKTKKIELFGLKTIIKPIASGKKILAPKNIDLSDPYFKDLNKTIPKNLAPTTDQSDVFRRFGDQAIQNWLNSPDVKNSSFGKAANKVEKAMKVEASLKSAPLYQGQPSIDHKISFQYLALQSQARIEYKGWTNAQFKVDSAKHETGVEVSEKIFKNKDLVVSHSKNSLENRSSMGLRWNW